MTSATVASRTAEMLVRSGTLAAAGQRRDSDHAPTFRIIRRLMANALAVGHSDLLLAIAPPTPSGATVFATGTMAPPAQAAAANAAAITMTQCDEGLREARGHPGLHAFPAAAAIVEERNGSLADVVHATAVGWEIGARLGLSLGAPRDGIHPHGGWGAAAAAAAAATAMALDEEAVTAAVMIALTVALTGPDSSTYTGQRSHYALPAFGTGNGVTAARLAAMGIEPPESALTHFETIAYGGHVTRVDLGDNLTERAYFKPIGVCAHALTAWEAARDLAATVDAATIAAVEVRTYAAAARLNVRQPSSPLARQFSIPWAVAHGLCGTDVTEDGSDRVRHLADAVSVVHNPALDERYPDARPVQVVVTTHQGSRHVATAEFHAGDRERPFTAEQHEQINRALLARTGAAPQAAKVYDRLQLPVESAWRSIVRLAGVPGAQAPREGKQ